MVFFLFRRKSVFQLTILNVKAISIFLDYIFYNRSKPTQICEQVGFEQFNI